MEEGGEGSALELHLLSTAQGPPIFRPGRAISFPGGGLADRLTLDRGDDRAPWRLAVSLALVQQVRERVLDALRNDQKGASR